MGKARYRVAGLSHVQGWYAYRPDRLLSGHIRL